MDSRIRILVVEDDADTALGTCRVLEQTGYAVSHAETIADAKELMQHERPELVLLDRNLPDGDGADFCRDIKADSTQSAVFVVIISASSTGADQQVEGLESGADGYITRPITNRELVARVEAFVRIFELSWKLYEQSAKLRKQNGELDQMNRYMLDRETRIMEMKKEVNELLVRLGEEEKYQTD